MPTDPSIIAGLSNATVPTQYSNLPSPGLPGGYPLGGSNPDSVIDYRIRNQGTVQNLIFPPDLPKYHFVIFENEFNRNVVTGLLGNRELTLERVYRLPLPSPITDLLEVGFEQNFSYLSAVKDAGQLLTRYLTPTNGRGQPIAGSAMDIMGRAVSGGGAIGQTIQSAAQAAGAAAGLTLNTFKTVTMSSPAYRTFQFSWKLSPKNFAESQTIQRIAMRLRKGMLPKRGLGGNKVILQFPKIYTMYFNPNVKFLYKFKPAVLTTMAIDFQGGNPFPAFYRSQAPNSPQESPPESIIISTNWLELEYWLDSLDSPDESDIKFGPDDVPTNDPFDGWNAYTYQNSDPLPPEPAQ